jgi:hypothetical protein
MRKVLALALAVSLSLVGIGFAQAANPKAGTKCAKIKQKVTYSGKSFTCVKKGKSLVWDAGVPVAKPAATKTVSEGFLCTEGSAPAKDANKITLYCTKGGDGKSSWRPQSQQGSGGGAGTGGGGAGTATPLPSCPTPLLQTPVDLSKVTSILYPGQERGGDYKAHGGFGFDNATDNLVTVKIPLSGKITSVVRYRELGEIQYLLEFEGDCGVSFRFDHLRKLTPKFEAVVNAFPIKEDTRGDRVSPPVAVTVGEVIATEVGFLNNVSVDFGVYDMRQKNEASKDPAWASAHSQYSTHSYGICWLNSLPQADSAAVKLLPSRDAKNGKRSDYCK